MALELSLPIIGFLAGLLLWSRLVYVTVGVLGAIGKVDLVVKLRNPSDSEISRFIAVLAVSAITWLLAFSIVVAHFALSVPPATGWALFFGGMAVTPCAIGLTTARAIRRIRRHRAIGAQP